MRAIWKAEIQNDGGAPRTKPNIYDVTCDNTHLDRIKGIVFEARFGEKK